MLHRCGAKTVYIQLVEAAQQVILVNMVKEHLATGFVEGTTTNILIELHI